MPRVHINDSKGRPQAVADFCQCCFQNQDAEFFGQLLGISPRRVDLDAPDYHPPYEGEEYDCAGCGDRLTRADND